MNMSVPPTEAFQGKCIHAAASIQFVYALIEVIDCCAVALMTLGWIANCYPGLIFAEIQEIFDHQPGWLIPLFIFYTSLRLVSAIGLWRNRMWGFWLTIFVIFATFIMIPFLLPITIAEMLVNALIMILLLIGYFGNQPILAASRDRNQPGRAPGQGCSQ